AQYVEAADQVQADDGFILFQRTGAAVLFDQAYGTAAACAVDHGPKAAQLLGGIVGCIHLLCVGDVGRHELGVATQRDGHVRAVRGGQVGDHDLGALFDQPTSRGQSQA